MKTRILFVMELCALLIAASALAADDSTSTSSAIAPVPLPVWQSEVVAPGVALTEQGVPGMALDPDGHPHIVYGENHLFHAWHDGASWQVETIDAASGSKSGPVIAIEHAGVITIVSCTVSNAHGVYLTAYRRAPGEAWQTAPIPIPVTGLFTVCPQLSLALGVTGQPHLIAAAPAFWSISSFVYAHASPSGWVSETVTTDHDVDGQPALALDSHDRPVVLYGSIESLWLARVGSDGWQHELLAAPVGAIIAGRALGLDSHDRAHVIFSDHQDTSLNYVHQTDAGWQAMRLQDDGTSPSLSMDDAGQPHIAYVSSPEGMVYGVYGSGGWTTTAVPVGEFGGSSNTLLLDDTGAAHIASLSFAHSLLYATNRGGQWTTRPVAVQDETGAPHALALDAADNPYLLYYQPATQQLRWAVRDGEGWMTSLVADVPPTDLELALAIGPNGVAQIAYINGDEDQVTVGWHGTTGWDLQSLTTDGYGLSLVVDGDNRPHLILTQNSQVVYWTRQGGVWQSEPVSPDEIGVGEAFLALDSQGRPKVVYHGFGGLIVAVRQGAGNWTTESLPLRFMTAMALGADDAVYLLHVTERFEDGKPPWHLVTLGLAQQQGNEWLDSLIYEDSFYGEYPEGRLQFDADGRLHMVTYRPFGWLYYQRRDAHGQWLDESVRPVGGAFALAVGSDGQPRLSHQFGGDLWLYRREILWLDHHALLPFVPVLGY